MAYVYIHTKLDDNKVFYVGIGSVSDGKYKRAFSKKRRGKFWKDFVKNKDYKVDIVLDNVSWEEACEKEIELIKMYGRRDLKQGELVNLTNGGDGVYGYIHTKEELEKLSKNSKGSNNGNAKSCIHFDSKIRFDSLYDGCKYFGLNYEKELNRVKCKLSTAKFYFEHKPFERPTKESISKKLSNLRIGNKNGKGNSNGKCKVIHIESLIVFDSIKEGCKYFNINPISEAARIRRNSLNRKFNKI